MTGPSNSPRPPEGERASVSVHESRPQSSCRDENRDREVIELHEIETHEDDEPDLSTASLSSGEEYQVTTRTTHTVTRTTSGQQSTANEEVKGVWGSARRFWTSHVILTVPQKANRDHFALERTFLAYIRTSVMLAMQGAIIAQLFRLQRIPVESRDSKLGFYEVGVPLSATCHGIAIVVALIGAYRFWKQQNAVSLGKVYSGGWELNFIGLLVTLVILAVFILSAVITAELE